MQEKHKLSTPNQERERVKMGHKEQRFKGLAGEGDAATKRRLLRVLWHPKNEAEDGRKKKAKSVDFVENTPHSHTHLHLGGSGSGSERSMQFLGWQFLNGFLW